MLIQSVAGQPDAIRLFESLIDNFPDMVHSVNETGAIIYSNKTMTQQLGYTEDELRAMNIRQLYPPEIMAAVEKGFREVKQSGEKRVESLFMARDGTRIPVEIRTIAIRDGNGDFAQTFSISRDLRQIKEMQDNLIHAGRLAAIGELAAGVVHDLNNPLTAIILASTVLKQVTANPAAQPQELREYANAYCETVNESASTMEHLTSRLRDFSRSVKEQHAPVDLFDPIQDALFILAHRIRHNNIRVTCPVAKAKHWVMGDRNQLQQIFLNLFANACDAMAQREVRELSVHLLTYELDGKPYWRCEVSDTGVGISAENQAQVFKAFFTTKPRGKGTGLGLSIARSIVKEHNGDILVNSAAGEGTTFSVLLPQMTPLAQA